MIAELHAAALGIVLATGTVGTGLGTRTDGPRPGAEPAASAVTREGIAGTKHNLSVTGPGPIRSTEETRICVFCHVPHRGGPGGTNRAPSNAPFRPYASETMRSTVPGAASGATRVCLSCHDGTIAVGQTLRSGWLRVLGGDAAGRIPTGPSNLGGRLDRSHPVSFRPAASPSLRQPRPRDPVKLDRNGELQCTACHDPHRDDADPDSRKFLVKPNRGGAICVSCHADRYWSSVPSDHQASTAQLLPGSPAAGYRTVAGAGCVACHDSHGAPEARRLLARAGDAVCLSCHDGRTARGDIAGEVGKPYAHGDRFGDSARVHEQAEGPRNDAHRLPETNPTAPRHATCVDCHNPHAANGRSARPPAASGALEGVWGIDRNGARVENVRYEYEVCFKCHGDSANQPAARGARSAGSLRTAKIDPNLRRAFDPSAASFHPVVAPGRGSDVPSLRAPLTIGSVIGCTDCHASDSGPGAGGTGPRGPHGSTYAALLERNLSTADGTPESPFAYALCYKCHDRDVLLSPRSAFPLHARHVQDGQPCNTCHDPHGVSALQGNPINNAHLVGFDASIVRPGPRGRLEYRSRGSRAGTCTVSCHGKKHDATPYGGAVLDLRRRGASSLLERRR